MPDPRPIGMFDSGVGGLTVARLMRKTCERIGLGLNAPRTGAHIQEVMERAYRSPPAVIDRLRQLNTP